MNGGCTHTCTNYVGGFNCSCNDGFQLMNDKKGCQRKSSAFNLSISSVQYLTNTVWQFFFLLGRFRRIVLNLSPPLCQAHCFFALMHYSFHVSITLVFTTDFLYSSSSLFWQQCIRNPSYYVLPPLIIISHIHLWSYLFLTPRLNLRIVNIFTVRAISFLGLSLLSSSCTMHQRCPLFSKHIAQRLSKVATYAILNQYVILCMRTTWDKQIYMQPKISYSVSERQMGQGLSPRL